MQTLKNCDMFVMVVLLYLFPSSQTVENLIFSFQKQFLFTFLVIAEHIGNIFNVSNNALLWMCFVHV